MISVNQLVTQQGVPAQVFYRTLFSRVKGFHQTHADLLLQQTGSPGRRRLYIPPTPASGGILREKDSWRRKETSSNTNRKSCIPKSNKSSLLSNRSFVSKKSLLSAD